MFVKPFTYQRAGSLADAAAALGDSDGALKVLAGGQSLLPMINMGLLDVEGLIDISHVDESREITAVGATIDIGALVRHCDLISSSVLAANQPMLLAAARWIGNARVRARGTIGGSLAHSDPAAELPLALIAADAEYVLTGGVARRTMPASEFHLSFFTTALEPGELLETVRVPTLDTGWSWGFHEVCRRRGDFALAAAAVQIATERGRVTDARVAVGGVGERPLRLTAVERRLDGAAFAEIPERVGDIEEIAPVTDTNASAEHRRHLCRIVITRALQDAFSRTGN